MDKTIKAGFTAVFSFIFSLIGILAIPVLLLLGCNIIDYITGLAAAKYRNPDDEQPIKSYLSIKGIIKKVCMYLLIIVGYFVDIMLVQGLSQLPIECTIQFPCVVSITICCWLIFNEMLSILENMEDIGVPIPPFLKPLLKVMKKKANIDTEEDCDDSDGNNEKD